MIHPIPPERRLSNKREQQKQDTLRIVAETMMFGLKEPEALKYFGMKLGRSIKHAHYWRVRNFLESSEANDMWINRHAQVGFIFNLRRRIDIVEKQIQDVLQSILIEKSKSSLGEVIDVSGNEAQKRNDWLILAYRKELRALILLAHELDATTPIVAKIKAMLLANNVTIPNKIGSEGAVAKRADHLEDVQQIDPKALEELWKYYDG